MGPGKVAVLMHELPEKQGSIYLPENGTVFDKAGGEVFDQGYFRDRMRPQVGTVIGSGADIEVGATAVVRVEDGKWWDNFIGSESSVKGQVRMYGLMVYAGESRVHEWDRSVIAEIDMGLRPTGRNYLILRSEASKKSKGGVLLTADFQERDHKAKILERGARASEFDVGDTVVYAAGAIVCPRIDADKELAETVMEMYGLPFERLEDLAIVYEDGIYAAV